jgi:hypothetical protein
LRRLAGAQQARKQGATRDEIADVLGAAVMVNAGATLVYSRARSMHFTPQKKLQVARAPSEGSRYRANFPGRRCGSFLEVIHERLHLG